MANYNQGGGVSLQYIYSLLPVTLAMFDAPSEGCRGRVKTDFSVFASFDWQPYLSFFGCPVYSFCL
jgi:hypothetical protein